MLTYFCIRRASRIRGSQRIRLGLGAPFFKARRACSDWQRRAPRPCFPGFDVDRRSGVRILRPANHPPSGSAGGASNLVESLSKHPPERRKSLGLHFLGRVISEIAIQGAENLRRSAKGEKYALHIRRGHEISMEPHLT